MNEIGVLSSKLEKVVGRKLVEVLKVKGLLAMALNALAPALVSAFDNNLAEKIPEPYNQKIEDTLVIILEEGDYEKAVVMATAFADSLVDIPGIDDVMEKMIFDGLAMVIAGLLAKLGVIEG